MPRLSSLPGATRGKRLGRVMRGYYIALTTKRQQHGHAAAIVLVADAVLGNEIADLDVSDLLSSVRTPTLALHARSDEVISVREGRRLAAEIPGAEFVELDSRNHVLLEHEPTWERFCDAVLSFTRGGAAGSRAAAPPGRLRPNRAETLCRALLSPACRSSLPLAEPPQLFAIAANLHVAPAPASIPGVVEEPPSAISGGARAHAGERW